MHNRSSGQIFTNNSEIIKMSLEKNLSKLNLDVKIALDIGAYHGTFTQMLRSIWPQIQVFSFEANDALKSINPEAIYCCLSDEPNKLVTYFLPNENQVHKTGASYYLELTDHFKTPVINLKATTTIDVLSDSIDFNGPWDSNGLIKLDTQGSEIDIIKGALKFIKKYKPLLFLIECSFIPYNKNAPLASDVIEFMNKLGYKFIDILDHWEKDDQLSQADLLFKRWDFNE